jgi:hypothetical protein
MNAIKTTLWLWQQGKARYILLVGVIGWGIPTGILFSLLNGWTSGEPHHFWGPRLAVSLVLFPIGGIFFGLVMWKRIDAGIRKCLGAGICPACGKPPGSAEQCQNCGARLK